MPNLITLATIFLTLSVITQGGSCRASNGGPSNVKMETQTPANKLPTGVWGGQHIRAEVTERGAQLEFDCAHGTIDQTIVLDASGKFDLPGKFTTERGGPIRRDEENNAQAVRYAGIVKAQELTLTITDTNNKEVLGTFTLRHGSEGRLMKCR